MNNYRTYGENTLKVAVIHGGPGAAGTMASVAQTLSSHYGVLEPLQTANTVEGQVEELGQVILNTAATPLTLVGHSWGAWLGYLYAAKYPELVSKLILVGSGPFDEQYAINIDNIRRSRLSDHDKSALDSLLAQMHDPDGTDRDDILSKLGKIMTKADSYDPIPDDNTTSTLNLDIFINVWPQAQELRKTGELLQLGYNIKCPVLAVHGDYDPHPHLGVTEPLSTVIGDFKFTLLEKCGHTPWLEKQAKEKFFSILHQEIL